ncbi:class I SAM-dependent methyltransferase [Bowmanella dokdonensis]|uniref:Methyltransferase domain-containing protein n=1 Tax=Bowmanella dokdonensis TaxID=751969 RepID=A0A939DM79_9ALTE|nr:class I SAM-dependent methyltransferase [Bowmanella dokdonensis]MBN7825053.1 methyltransferase domain-containing protein [Bowmanella dokdonensis]
MFDSYQKIFKSRAWLYHRAMERSPRARDAEFSIALEYLQPKAGQWLADMPAGGGYLKQYLQDDSPHCLFIETTSEFARHCPTSSGCKSLIGDFHALPLQDAGVQRMLSLAALHHVEDKLSFFRECARVLDPSGRLVVADVLRDTPQAKFLNEFVHEFNSMGHEGLFWDESVQEQLDANGFRVERAKLHNFTWNFTTQEEMVSYCRDLFGLDKADEQTILSGIQDYLSPGESDGKHRLQWSLYYLSARPAPRLRESAYGR